MFVKFNNFRNFSFSDSLLYAVNIMNSFNSSLICTSEVSFLCKIVRRLRGLGFVHFDTPKANTKYVFKNIYNLIL